MSRNRKASYQQGPLTCEVREKLEQFWSQCSGSSVMVYGPYAPCKGRTRWRVQVYIKATGKKMSCSVRLCTNTVAIRMAAAASG